MERERDVVPDCTRFQSEFPAYLYGEILPEAGSALERHLETCGACRDELATLRETRAALDRWVVPASGDAAASLAAAVRRRAGELEPAEPQGAPRRTRPRARLTRLSAWVLGAAAGLLFALGLFSTEARIGDGRLALSFALPGLRAETRAPDAPLLSEERVRAIAAQEVSSRTANMERSSLELSRMTREELYQEILSLSQAVDRALAENQRLYDARLADVRRTTEANDLAQRQAISNIASYIRPASNR